MNYPTTTTAATMARPLHPLPIISEDSDSPPTRFATETKSSSPCPSSTASPSSPSSQRKRLRSPTGRSKVKLDAEDPLGCLNPQCPRPGEVDDGAEVSQFSQIQVEKIGSLGEAKAKLASLLNDRKRLKGMLNNYYDQDDSLMCHSLLGSEDSRCTVTSTRHPSSRRVSAVEGRQLLGEKLKAMTRTTSSSPMRAEEMSPKLSIAVLLTTTRFPGCILVRNDKSSRFHLPGSLHQFAFGRDLQAGCRDQVRVETGLALPDDTAFHAATCLEYLDVNSEGKADEIRLVLRSELPQHIVSSEHFTHNKTSWSWEHWEDMKADQMGTDLRRLRCSKAVAFEQAERADI